MTKDERAAHRAISPEVVAIKQEGARRAMGMLSQALKDGTLVRVSGPGISRTLRKV